MEYYVVCNSCGKGFVYTDADLEQQRRASVSNLFSGLAEIAGGLSGNLAGGIVGKMYEEEVKDYTKCPHCGSNDLRHVTQEEFQKSQKAATGVAGAAININTNASVEALIKRTRLFIEDEEWDKAEVYCNQILDADPENAQVYYLLALVESHVTNPQDLVTNGIDLRQSKYYKSIVRFADQDFRRFIDGINAAFDTKLLEDKRRAQEQIEREEQMQREQEVKLRAEKYQQAISFVSSSDINTLEKAIEDLESLGDDYKETKQYKEQFKQNLLRAKKERALKRKKIIARVFIAIAIAVVCAAFVIVLITVIIPNLKRSRAMALIDTGDYETAYALLEEIDESDTVAGKYARAMTLLDDNKYNLAYAYLEEIGDNEAILSNKYDRAIALIDSGDYENAYHLLKGLNYKDSAERLKSIIESIQSRLSSAQVGELVTFGSYEQDNNASNGKEDIEWLVLEKDGGRMLLISRYALSCEKYNLAGENVTWETCSLRSWLNETLLYSAFKNTIDRDCILSTTIKALDNRNTSYGQSPAENDTTDKVFILSMTEVRKYFNSDDARKCRGTAFCYAQGAFKSNTNSNGVWWLRSPGRNSSYAAVVNEFGSVFPSGTAAIDDRIAVRPAMWINLE